MRHDTTKHPTSRAAGASSRSYWPAALSAVAVASFLLLSTGQASANGRFPASNAIVFSPTDPNLVIARTTYALLPSRDNGATWRYLCEDALGLPAASYQDPEIGLTASNAFVAGLYGPASGLEVSRNVGCDWNCIGGPLVGQAIADIVVRPDRPHVVLALTSTFLPADAGGGALSQVFQSADDGANWTALGVPLDPMVHVQTIDVAPGDPHRVYVSGTRGFRSSRTASLFVSTDDAAHWTESAITHFDPTTEDSVFIGAVDPVDPLRVYIRSSAAAPGGRSRLFMTADAGQSFQLAKELAIAGDIVGFALSADGSKVYAGTSQDGLFVAAKGDLTFRKTSSIHVQCLASRGTELWACSDAVSGFIVGMSRDDGATFVAKLPSVAALAGRIACSALPGGPLACGATANASQCQESFDTFCQIDSPSGRCGDAAATSGDGSADAGNGGAFRTSSRPGSGGCSAIGDPRASGMIVFSMVAAAAMLRRARRSSRRCAGGAD